MSTKLDVNPEDWVFEIVSVVIAALRATSNTAAVFKLIVKVPAEIVGAAFLSTVLIGKNRLLSSITVVP
jgi:hypothetical protein